MAEAHDHHEVGWLTGAPRGTGWSPLQAGLGTRLAIAGGLIALLWLVVGWSLRP